MKRLKVFTEQKIREFNMIQVTKRNFKATKHTSYKYDHRESQIVNNKKRRAMMFLYARVGKCTQCENALPQNRCKCGYVYVCNACVKKCIEYQVRICEQCS